MLSGAPDITVTAHTDSAPCQGKTGGRVQHRDDSGPVHGSRTEHVSACQRVSLYGAHRARDSPGVDDEAQRARAVRILVRSLYRDLVAQGFDDKQILAVAIELVGKVTEKLAGETTQRRA